MNFYENKRIKILFKTMPRIFYYFDNQNYK